MSDQLSPELQKCWDRPPAPLLQLESCLVQTAPQTCESQRDGDKLLQPWQGGNQVKSLALPLVKCPHRWPFSVSRPKNPPSEQDYFTDF